MIQIPVPYEPQNPNGMNSTLLHCFMFEYRNELRRPGMCRWKGGATNRFERAPKAKDPRGGKERERETPGAVGGVADGRHRRDGGKAAGVARQGARREGERAQEQWLRDAAGPEATGMKLPN